MNFNAIDRITDGMQDELLHIMKKWIAVNSVLADPAPGAPFGEDCRKILDIAMEDGRSFGFECESFDGYCGHIAMPSGRADAKTMGILCHLDVVPAGDGWTHDPFGGEIEDGKIYGRGVMDDKGPALAAMFAMRAVREAGIPMKDNVRLILGCDEETGMKDMRHYASVNTLPDYGFSPDAEFPVINIEKGGLSLRLICDASGEDGAQIPVLSLYAGERQNVVPGLAFAEVSTARVSFEEMKTRLEEVAKARGFILSIEKTGDVTAKITAEGVSAHASLPHLGKNAAGMLLIALADMKAGGGLQTPIRVLAGKIGLEGDGKSLGIAVSDEESGALTCNLGILRCDGRVLTAQLDIRFPLCAVEETMCGQAAVAVSEGRFGVIRLGCTHPHYVPESSPVVQGLLRSYHEVTNLPAYAFAIGGGTYSKCMPNTVAFGLCFPGDDDPCHMPDEYIEIEKLMTSVKIMAHAIANLAGEDA